MIWVLETSERKKKFKSRLNNVEVFHEPSMLYYEDGYKVRNKPPKMQRNIRTMKQFSSLDQPAPPVLQEKVLSESPVIHHFSPKEKINQQMYDIAFFLLFTIETEIWQMFPEDNMGHSKLQQRVLYVCQFRNQKTLY